MRTLGSKPCPASATAGRTPARHNRDPRQCTHVMPVALGDRRRRAVLHELLGLRMARRVAGDLPLRWSPERRSRRSPVAARTLAVRLVRRSAAISPNILPAPTKPRSRPCTAPRRGHRRLRTRRRRSLLLITSVPGSSSRSDACAASRASVDIGSGPRTPRAAGAPSFERRS